jgi:hypothetical protein
LSGSEIRESPARLTPGFASLNPSYLAALMEKAKAGDLFAKPPEILKLEILAHKLPK